jgi:Patatin-like phospholipase
LPRSSGFRILAIDGGGIRGIIPATFLAALERLLGDALARRRGDPAGAPGWEGIDQPRIADCFHLIAGTSTGGLLAAGLTTTDVAGRPKLAAEDAATVYVDYGAAIFHRPLLRNLLDHFALLLPKYPLAQLRKVLELDSVLGDGLLKDARTEVLILSFDTALPGPRYFTRWGAPGAGGTPSSPTETMVEVALATAAAPTYFEPETLARAPLIDGGVYAGNPALAAISMALRRTVEPVPRTAADVFMVSLGTGAWSERLDYGLGGIFGWLRPRPSGEALLEAMLGGSSDFANEAAHLLLNGDSETSPPASGSPGTPETVWWQPNLPRAAVGGGPQLWRYQPGLPGPIALDDVSKLPELEQIAEQQVNNYQGELERLAEMLIDAGPVPP